MPSTGTPDLDLPLALRRVQDLTRGSRADPTTLTRAVAELHRLADHLSAAGADDLPYSASVAVGERGRSQALVPRFRIDHSDARRISGHVTFSRFYVGDRFAHGGAIALFFDDILGRMVASQLRPSIAKTAHLSLDFRRPAAVGVEVAFAARVDRVEGRKHFVSAALRTDGELIAEAKGIWIGERDK